MKINSIKNLKNLAGKKVLLRVDYNVPLEGKKIKDDFRIKASYDTINYLQEKGAKIILVSHLGRAKGKVDSSNSLKPVFLYLKENLSSDLKFISEHDPKKAKKETDNLKEGEIAMIENVRFNKGELTDDKKFSKELANLAEIYVNDAFSVCHRKQASVSGVKEYLPSYAGFLIEKEVEALNKVVNPKKPLVAIMGGAKISTKAPLIFNLHDKADNILIGGALATVFFKTLGYEVGNSFCENEVDDSILEKMKNKKYLKKIILPIDVVVQNKKGIVRQCVPESVKKNESILDIGPETIGLFAKHIKEANTLIWNGPMGKFEEHSFRQGSLSIARSIASRAKGPSFGVLGGGETIEVIKMTKMSEYIDFISTAGGAMLSFLGGKELPGLNKIVSY
ncbi:MAG: phosphoglycerate kinase [Patescibacteria group bacterium]|jgi:phosphoglycerate kinase|nr:phosphoglycerate kinase [Patescibacteria group bacterium]